MDSFEERRNSAFLQSKKSRMSVGSKINAKLARSNPSDNKIIKEQKRNKLNEDLNSEDLENREDIHDELNKTRMQKCKKHCVKLMKMLSIYKT